MQRSWPARGRRGVPWVPPSCRRLPRQQCTLALNSPSIAGEPAIAPDHAMAWNRHRQRVGRAGLRNCARRTRLPDALRELRVARGCTSRDSADRVPYPFLKRGPAHIERQIKTLPWCLNKPDHLGHKLLKCAITAQELRLRKAILQPTDEPVWIVAELDRTYALVGRSHQDRAKRTLADRKTDHIALTAGTELSRSHAEEIV